MKRLALTMSLLVLASCNRVSSMADAEIPACASSQRYSNANKGISKVYVDQDCWSTFVERISDSGGELCERQLVAGEGCEYSTRRGDFILSPSGRASDGERTFILTDLRY